MDTGKSWGFGSWLSERFQRALTREDVGAQLSTIKKPQHLSHVCNKTSLGWICESFSQGFRDHRTLGVPHTRAVLGPVRQSCLFPVPTIGVGWSLCPVVPFLCDSEHESMRAAAHTPRSRSQERQAGGTAQCHFPVTPHPPNRLSLQPLGN